MEMSFYLQINTAPPPHYPLDRMLGRPQGWSERGDENKNHFSYQKSSSTCSASNWDTDWHITAHIIVTCLTKTAEHGVIVTGHTWAAFTFGLDCLTVPTIYFYISLSFIELVDVFTISHHENFTSGYNYSQLQNISLADIMLIYFYLNNTLIKDAYFSLTSIKWLYNESLYCSQLSSADEKHQITRAIQKFPDWPPRARTSNGTALCH
jgi:hypothetical protein